jgi:hypothetical protein
MEANGTPPEGYLVSVEENGTTIKRIFQKRRKRKLLLNKKLMLSK